MRLHALRRSVLPALVSAALLVPGPAGAQESVGEPTATTTAEPTPEPEPTTEPDPMAGAPAVGTCADMTWDDAIAETAPATSVDCDRRHTTQVVAVGQLPEDVSWEQRRQVGKAVDAACDPAWEAVTSEDHLLYRRSAYQKFWFIPSAEEREAGARWFRCDLARVKGKDLMTVSSAALPRVTPKLHGNVRRCMTKDFLGTVCTAHYRTVHWRGKDAFWLTVPTNDARAQQKVRRVALDRCADAARTPSYAWSWFADKNRRWVVVCYEKS